jgi:sulfide:quinone oxidoreductase
MEGSPVRVLIAGGGVAGLETLTGLRELAGDRVALTLAAPDDEFIYRPVTIARPYSVRERRSVALARAAEEVGATFLSATVETVDSKEKTVLTSAGERLAYDALVLAVGAAAVPALEHVMTWDDRSDSEVLGGLLRDSEEGYLERFAVVIPPGPGWPLRGYELALLITLGAYDVSVDIHTTIVQPEPPPLALLGDRAVSGIAAELERAGIAVVPAEQISIERGHRVDMVLQPSRQRLEVDRALAMPILRGDHRRDPGGRIQAHSDRLALPGSGSRAGVGGGGLHRLPGEVRRRCRRAGRRNRRGHRGHRGRRRRASIV